MADKKLNAVSTASDGAYVYAEDANGNQIKISKADLASVVAGLIGNRFVKLGTTRNFSQDIGTISPVGTMGLIMLEANVNYASESNNSASLWLYMNTVNGTNTGYTKTGVSVIKIASLKHDFASGITDCSLSGSESGDIITINKGGFNTFSYIDIPL